MPVHGAFATHGIPAAQHHLAFLPGRLLAIVANVVGTVAVVGTRAGSPSVSIVDVKAGTRKDLALPALRGRLLSTRRYAPTHASPDGSLLAIAADDGKVLAWKLPSGDGPRTADQARLGERSRPVAGWALCRLCESDVGVR